MCKILNGILVIVLLIQSIQLIEAISNQSTSNRGGNELSAIEPSGPVPDRNNRARGWMDSAKNTLSGPAGQLMVHFAKEMISRSAGNSQVFNQCESKLVFVIIIKFYRFLV